MELIFIAHGEWSMTDVRFLCTRIVIVDPVLGARIGLWPAWAVLGIHDTCVGTTSAGATTALSILVR